MLSTVGNGLYIDTDKEAVVIKPKEGFGGIGGEYIKLTALANVRAFYTRLKPESKEGKVDLKYSDEFLILYFQAMVEGISKPEKMVDTGFGGLNNLNPVDTKEFIKEEQKRNGNLAVARHREK